MKFGANAGSNERGIESKNFIKLNDGQEIVGVFRGDPFEFQDHWINNRSQECTGSSCEHCKAGIKSGFKFRINFITKENNEYVAKIFERGWSVYKTLRKLHEGDYNLEKTIVKIKRIGSTRQNTEYSVLPIPKYHVNAQLENTLAKVKLHDLAKVGQESAPAEQNDANDFSAGFGDDVPFPTDDDCPF